MPRLGSAIPPLNQAVGWASSGAHHRGWDQGDRPGHLGSKRQFFPPALTTFCRWQGLSRPASLEPLCLLWPWVQPVGPSRRELVLCCCSQAWPGHRCPQRACGPARSFPSCLSPRELGAGRLRGTDQRPHHSGEDTEAHRESREVLDGQC